MACSSLIAQSALAGKSSFLVGGGVMDRPRVGGEVRDWRLVGGGVADRCLAGTGEVEHVPRRNRHISGGSVALFITVL